MHTLGFETTVTAKGNTKSKTFGCYNMRIQEWLRNTVADPNYNQLLWWHDEEQGLIAIRWKHASYDDYCLKDSGLFKKWAMDNSKFNKSSCT